LSASSVVDADQLRAERAGKRDELRSELRITLDEIGLVGGKRDVAQTMRADK